MNQTMNQLINQLMMKIIVSCSLKARTSKLAVGDNRPKDSLWGRSLFVTVNLTTSDLRGVDRVWEQTKGG